MCSGQSFPDEIFTPCFEDGERLGDFNDLPRSWRRTVNDSVFTFIWNTWKVLEDQPYASNKRVKNRNARSRPFPREESWPERNRGPTAAFACSLSVSVHPPSGPMSSAPCWACSAARTASRCCLRCAPRQGSGGSGFGFQSGREIDGQSHFGQLRATRLLLLSSTIRPPAVIRFSTARSSPRSLRVASTGTNFPHSEFRCLLQHHFEVIEL